MLLDVSTIRRYLIAPARWRGMRALLKLMPFVPRGRLGQAVRYGLIKATRNAPLQFAIARGDTVVQVGATADGELWDMVRLVGQGGRVIVIESFPHNVKAIKELLSKESIRNVTVVPKGAWTEPGRQKLYIDPRYNAGNIMLDSGAKHDKAMGAENYPETLEIEVDRLDNILANEGIDKCDFIKITVNGAEVQVLKGMDRILNSNPTVWVKAHSLINGQPANILISKMFDEKGFQTVITRDIVTSDGLRRSGDVYAMRKKLKK